MTSGTVRIQSRIPSTGHVKAIAIPVDFPLYPGLRDPKALFDPALTEVERYFLDQSGGLLDLQISIHPTWIHLKSNPASFKLGSKNPSNAEYAKALLEASMTDIELSQYQVVYFLIPREVPITEIARGSALLSSFDVPGGILSNIVLSGGDLNFQIKQGSPEKEVLYYAHETGHLLGLFDEDIQHVRHSLGPWSLMANIWDDGNTSFIAWDKYIQGWMSENQFKCFDAEAIKSRTKVRLFLTLNKMYGQQKAANAIFIKWSSHEVIVIENIKLEQPGNARTKYPQTLIYLVDVAKGQAQGGYQVIPRAGYQDDDHSDAGLVTGEFARYKNFKFEVVQSSQELSKIVIQKF